MRQNMRKLVEFHSKNEFQDYIDTHMKHADVVLGIETWVKTGRGEYIGRWKSEPRPYGFIEECRTQERLDMDLVLV